MIQIAIVLLLKRKENILELRMTMIQMVNVLLKRKENISELFNIKYLLVTNGERFGHLLHLYQGYHMNSDAKFVKKAEMWASGSHGY